MKTHKPVVVLGGGVSGLAAASIKIPEGRKISIGYHRIVKSDRQLLGILNKLGLLSRVRWKNIHISTLIGRKNMNLASPKDILAFRTLPLLSRFRYMLMGIRCLLIKNWSVWQNKTVTELIKTWADDKVLQTIFAPLVDIKFGCTTDKADAAWLGFEIKL